MLKLKKVSEGFYKATNVVSNWRGEVSCYIDQDMLGDFRGTVEVQSITGELTANESDGYSTLEEAANWIECQGIVMTTYFDGSPMLEECA